MYRQPPKINTDTAADIERQLIADLIPGSEVGGVQKNVEGSLNAMIKIFSYYCQLIIDRQNKSLDKNFLAFLNLLGASLKPAQPARVLLTFTMAKGASVDALIPKGTQVAAQITSDRRDMVVYETEADFVATSFELVNEPSFAFQDDNFLKLYFCLPKNRKEIPRSSITLYVVIDSKQESNDPEYLSWQYSSSKDGWSDLAVDDETNHFTRSGFLSYIPPADFSQADQGFCIRVIKGKNARYNIRQIHLNTTRAIQAISVRNEVLGSSNGSERQAFNTARHPILAGPNKPRLEVRDPASAPAEEHWISWEEKPDFFTSGPQDRHYVINHVKGEIIFGDGHHGMIPPLGKRNIRMAYYQTGGGLAGNQPIGSIVNLKTTIPYVKSVVNYFPATGGTDPETISALKERVPCSLRHQGRAVTLEDYEDLAKEASREVARAKCVQLSPGSVQLTIVPSTADPQPRPTTDLRALIHDFLAKHCDPSATLEITDPVYIEIEVATKVAVIFQAQPSIIKKSIEQRIAGFLHPLTGGFDGLGWEFNRKPYRSDLYRVLESLAEVEYVHSLEILEKSPRLSNDQPKPFLISSGIHTVTIQSTTP